MEILYFDGGAIHGNDGYACALAKGTVDARRHSEISILQYRQNSAVN